MALDFGQTVSVYWPARHANCPAKLPILGESGRALVQQPNSSQTWELPDQLKKMEPTHERSEHASDLP